MPIYEYRCADCRKKFEVLVLRAEEESALRCPHCSSAKMKRLISRFTSIKSEEARLESLTDPSNLSGLDENDPASMARWLKRMGGELGGPGGGGGLEGGGLGSDPSDDIF